MIPDSQACLISFDEAPDINLSLKCKNGVEKKFSSWRHWALASLLLATRHPLHICLLLLGDGSVKQATPQWTETHRYSARPIPLYVFCSFSDVGFSVVFFFYLSLCFLFLFIFILLHSALVASLRNSLASPRQIGQVRLDWKTQAIFKVDMIMDHNKRASLDESNR